MTQIVEQYHLVRRLREQISQRADQIAFREWSPEGEKQLTWQQVDTHVTRISAALLSLGVGIQERVGIFANNSMAWSLADLAILQLRGVSVPLYATNTTAQAAYVVNDADVRILFVGGQKQFDIALTLRSLCPQLVQIIALEPSVDLRGCGYAQHLADFEQQSNAVQPHLLTSRIESCGLDDLFTLIYTSGTTGEPKGVMLDYRNMAAHFICTISV